MVDIAIRSRFDTPGALCDIHHIARSVLHQTGEDHRIAGYTQEASTSHEPFIRPPVSSRPSRMQPVRGRGRGRERGGGGGGGVDRRGRARDGGSGHGPDSESGLGTLKSTLPTSIRSYTYPSPELFIPPHTPAHHLPYPLTLTHHLPYPHIAHHLPYSHTLTRL